MSFEVRKLLKNRWLLVVAAVLLILSCTMYTQNIYITQQGNDYRTIREYYQNPSAFLSANENMPAVVSTAESETVDRMQVQKNYAAEQDAAATETYKDGDPAMSCFSMRDPRLNYTVKIISKFMQ